MHRGPALAALLAASCSTPRVREFPIDAQLAVEIGRIKAIDNHAHPLRPTARAEKPDEEYDALPVEGLEPSSEPWRLRPQTGAVAEARKALFRNDKPRAMRMRGENYAAWVLDQVGIETMLANRVGMGKGLPAPRFLWVPFADALLFPRGGAPSNPDNRFFYANEERLEKRYLKEAGYDAPPGSLEEYLTRIVRPTLERFRQQGAVAVKFELAYLRTLEIGNPARAEAEKAYAGGGDYKALQDYLFRLIATECGRLGMPVHIHAAAGGGGYFSVSGANPMLLEPLFNDPSLRKTNFVILHSGWPFEHQVAALLTKPNVYVDFSAQWAWGFERSAATTLREWIQYVPEKVLFGTDTYPYSPEMGWEEIAWIATGSARQAVGVALTGMLRDGDISRDRALELARMVLRENARKLYGLN